MLLYFGCKDTGFILVTHSIYFTNTFTQSHIQKDSHIYTFTQSHIQKIYTIKQSLFRVQRYVLSINLVDITIKVL